MKQVRTIAALAAVMMAIPAVAYGAPRGAYMVPHWLSIAVGLAGLVISLVLLLTVHTLRNVAGGSMMADNIVYIMLAVICLAASMIARWVGIVATDDGLTQLVSLAGDLLVTAGMALLGLYFHRVRVGMTRYLKAATEYSRSLEAHEDGTDA